MLSIFIEAKKSSSDFERLTSRDLWSLDVQKSIRSKAMHLSFVRPAEPCMLQLHGSSKC